MTPTDQEFIHAPENGQYGDCQRAVIASLLDLPITAVPHFLQEAAGDPVPYWEKLQAFVRSHGFVYLNVPARAGLAFYGDEGDVFHEISGPSPRGNGVGHEIVKRSQAKDAHLNPRLVIGVCAAHNSWVEDNPYEAQIAGLSVPGWVWRNDGEDALAEAARRRTSLWTGTPMAPPWWLNLR